MVTTDATQKSSFRNLISGRKRGRSGSSNKQKLVNLLSKPSFLRRLKILKANLNMTKTNIVSRATLDIFEDNKQFVQEANKILLQIEKTKALKNDFKVMLSNHIAFLGKDKNHESVKQINTLIGICDVTLTAAQYVLRQEFVDLTVNKIVPDNYAND